MITAATDAARDDAGVWPVPPQIGPKHKQRFAVIYLRQSSPDQVRHHSGSTDAQRALAEQPRRWGWPESSIIVIDDDLGLSGTSSQQRLGFQRLLQIVERDQVGIVLVRDISRITRDPLDAERFFKLAMRREVLVEIGGRVYDPANGDLPELFGLRIQALLAWWENQHRVLTFKAAKKAKVQAGYAVTRPPIGYVTATRGKWTKDEQPVQLVVRRVFDLYLELRSVEKVAKRLREDQTQFPKRVRGRLLWEFVGPLEVLRVLSSPNYTGDYVFGRRRLLPSDDDGRRRVTRTPPADWLVSRNHHEAYVSRAEWDEIQLALHGRGRGPNRRPPEGKGSGLLQSRVVCGLCGRWMKVAHDGRPPAPGEKKAPRYVCVRQDKYGALVHTVTCSGIILDHAVVREILATLAPPSLETVLAVVNEEKDKQSVVEASLRREMRQAEDDVQELSRVVRRIHRDNAEVVIHYERELREALRRQADLKHEMARRKGDPAAVLSEADAAELLRIAADIEGVWNAPTTSNEDRKHLIDLVVSRVVVRKPSNEENDIEIVWVSGIVERHRPLKPKGVDRFISELRGEGKTVSEILATLTAIGVRTGDGRAFTRKALQHKLWMQGFDTKTDRIAALRLIQSMLLDRRSRREILDRLRAEGPQPKDGEWTSGRLGNAITSLKRNLLPGDVPPLPPGMPLLRRLPPEAIDVIRESRAAGHSFKVIAADLNARGFRPPRAAKFTMMGLYQLHQQLRIDGALDAAGIGPTDGLGNAE